MPPKRPVTVADSDPIVHLRKPKAQKIQASLLDAFKNHAITNNPVLLAKHTGTKLAALPPPLEPQSNGFQDHGRPSSEGGHGVDAEDEPRRQVILNIPDDAIYIDSDTDADEDQPRPEVICISDPEIDEDRQPEPGNTRVRGRHYVVTLESDDEDNEPGHQATPVNLHVIPRGLVPYPDSDTELDEDGKPANQPGFNNYDGENHRLSGDEDAEVEVNELVNQPDFNDSDDEDADDEDDELVNQSDSSDSDDEDHRFCDEENMIGDTIVVRLPNTVSQVSSATIPTIAASTKTSLLPGSGSVQTFRQMQDQQQRSARFKHVPVNQAARQRLIDTLLHAVGLRKPSFKEPVRQFLSSVNDQEEEPRTVQYDEDGNYRFNDVFYLRGVQKLVEQLKSYPHLTENLLEISTGTRKDGLICMFNYPCLATGETNWPSVVDFSSATTVTTETLLGGLQGVSCHDVWPYRQESTKQPHKMFTSNLQRAFLEHATTNWTSSGAKVGILFGEKAIEWYRSAFVQKNRCFPIKLGEFEVFNKKEHAYIEFGPRQQVKRITFAMYHPSAFNRGTAQKEPGVETLYESLRAVVDRPTMVDYADLNVQSPAAWTTDRTRKLVNVGITYLDSMDTIGDLFENGHAAWRKSIGKFSQMTQPDEKWRRAYETTRVLWSAEKSFNVTFKLDDIPTEIIKYVETLLGRPFHNLDGLETPAESLFAHVMRRCQIPMKVDGDLDKTMPSWLKKVGIPFPKNPKARQGSLQKTRFMVEDIGKLLNGTSKQALIEIIEKRNSKQAAWVARMLGNLKSMSTHRWIKWMLSEVPWHHRRSLLLLPARYIKFFDKLKGWDRF